MWGWLVLLREWLSRPRRRRVVSPGGLVTITLRSPVAKPSDEIVAVPRLSIEKEYACGHIGPALFSLNLYGEERPVPDQGTCCPMCLTAKLREVSIRCALCGLIILPGSPVAVYGLGSEGLRLDIAHRVDGGVVGCLGWDCCPTTGLFVGHWDGRGIQSRFEGRSIVDECLQTGRTISGTF